MTYVMVADIDGQKVVKAKLFVQFTAMIGDEERQIAITELPGKPQKLTDVATGAAFWSISSTDIAIGQFDWEKIGRHNLLRLIREYGEIRILEAIQKWELKNGKSD